MKEKNPHFTLPFRAGPHQCLEMAEFGNYNVLTVLRETRSGFFLDGGNLGEILLPGPLAPEGMVEGDEVEVFLYTDTEDRLIATTDEPVAVAGEFAPMTVVAVHSTIGAFLDWGLGKDLLLPFREQGDVRVEEGERVVVYVKVDPVSNRIIATMRWDGYLSTERPSFKTGDAVEFLVTHRTPLGFVAIVDGQFSGLIYHSTLGVTLLPGDLYDGYVRSVRSDGKIDLSLDPPGPPPLSDLRAQILSSLKEEVGHLPYDDSTPPELIRQVFNVSKKVFKRTLATLYKERKIEFPEGGGIQLPKAK